ncbi:transcription factor 15-like isoform X2 [Adelges cooleyi]|uniref:transcription factor 15-like isoform X2 n=1 Tax=Adelges cooleyi TaxID=133065 RepID=UPI0021806982|nr:transcription factor 15-like isoform X2 [Adelges cooleyi]
MQCVTRNCIVNRYNQIMTQHQLVRKTFLLLCLRVPQCNYICDLLIFIFNVVKINYTLITHTRGAVIIPTTITKRLKCASDASDENIDDSIMHNNTELIDGLDNYIRGDSIRPTNDCGVTHKRIRTGANARERDRTQSVNAAFDLLRSTIPIDPPDRSLSKIETLQLAMKYINHLSRISSCEDCSAYEICIFCLANKPITNNEQNDTQCIITKNGLL